MPSHRPESIEEPRGSHPYELAPTHASVRRRPATRGGSARWLAIPCVALAMCLCACNLTHVPPAHERPAVNRAGTATAPAACAAVIDTGHWGVLSSGVSARVATSRLVTNSAELASTGITQSTSAAPWLVVVLEVRNTSRLRIGPSALGLRLVYPGMIVDDPDDDDSSGAPSTLFGRDAAGFGAPGSTSTLTVAFLVPPAASPRSASLKTLTPSGCDEYFRLR